MTSGEIPHINWKQLTVNELKHFYENDPKDYGRTETDVVVSLVHLVEKGLVKAYMKPDGKIAYQSMPEGYLL